MKKIALVLLLLTCGSLRMLHAQNITFHVPQGVTYQTNEDYARYENDIVACANWLESIPVGAEDKKRKAAQQFMFAWLQGSPNVSVTISAALANLTENNPELLGAYLAAYARYMLQNKANPSEPLAAEAGLKSIVKLYQLGGGVKSSKALDKLVLLAQSPDGLLKYAKQEFGIQ